MSDEIQSVLSKLATSVDVLRGELASGFAEVRAQVARAHHEPPGEGDARDRAWVGRLGRELGRLSAELRSEMASLLERERVAWQRLLDQTATAERAEDAR